MIISHNPNHEINIVTKNHSIKIGSEVKIDSFIIPGAGEYDIANIQCTVNNLEQATVFLIRTEDLILTFLSKLDPDVIKLNDTFTTNILIINLLNSNRLEELGPILKVLEPSYVFLISNQSTSELNQILNLPIEVEGAGFKITRNGLPLEGIYLVADPSS